MPDYVTLMGVGFPPAQTLALDVTPQSLVPTAGVTAQSGSTKIGTRLSLLTVSTSTATSFQLPATPQTGTIHYVTNLLASTVTAQIYPATSAYMVGAQNAASTLTTGQSALFICEANGTAAAINWYVIKSA